MIPRCTLVSFPRPEPRIRSPESIDQVIVSWLFLAYCRIHGSAGRLNRRWGFFAALISQFLDGSDIG
jgi:hypothetical protein